MLYERPHFRVHVKIEFFRCGVAKLPNDEREHVGVGRAREQHLASDEFNKSARHGPHILGRAVAAGRSADFRRAVPTGDHILSHGWMVLGLGLGLGLGLELGLMLVLMMMLMMMLVLVLVGIRSGSGSGSSSGSGSPLCRI